MGNDRSPERIITDEIRAEALTRPGGWIYALDPYFESKDNVPPYGIEGAWKVDDDGCVIDHFHVNKNYKPSPITLAMPAPRDPVEAAMQLSATGYGSDREVNRALMNATVFVRTTAPQQLPIYTDADSSFVDVFTNMEAAIVGSPEIDEIAFPSLLHALPDGILLRINPGSSITVRIPIDKLRLA
ncbi:type VII secretion system-associated protein [Nocardia sp. NPDC058666]|uniref:type VII secretion system-associated protein n=1 Tax=Nocardia sp. NPDC058666 TaxID=3346587 RepID=UPI00366735B0